MISPLINRYQQLSPERKQLLFHTGLAGIFRVLSACAAFLLSIVVARILGPTESGYFFLGLGLTTMLGTLCLLGMDNALLRFIGRAYADISTTNQVYSNAYLATVPASFAVGLLVYCITPWLAQSVFNKPDFTPVLQCFAITIPFITLYLLNGYALQAARKVIAAVCSMQLGVTVLALPVLLMLPKDVATADTAARIYLVVSAITVLIGLWLWLRMPGHKFDIRNRAMPALWQSLPSLWLISATGQALPWASIVVVGVFSTSDDVALFSAAQRTSLLISFMLMVVNFVAAPRFSALYHSGQIEQLKTLAQFSTRLMAMISLPVLGVILIWPDVIMSLFGEQFAQASSLLIVLAIGQGVNVTTGSVGFLLTMYGHEQDMRNITVFSGIFTLTLLYLLTVHMGTMGAAIAVTVGVSTQNLLALYAVKRRLGFIPVG
ncbi:oligosaccharide flippase family protein [Enterovibrio nigricans]|uniref:Membrane protein involved in the export of O-antigen and teichoic acid n=1 Tax=Enterovibrio nigricans DSM 22720 TaxID=1121868 RepID=A0A1T4TW21_9GAMM|nr:oligosaccharide flippase family protein [Enterovibrio nigricans]PKF50694.1 capsular biosynthesis protein CpsJ [Enterovibrio nigricans]SKA44491.1 Membrane protein involved in the export of O-antigen and teichoic acid [Enterovibrio nigricans DSM 22720]